MLFPIGHETFLSLEKSKRKAEVHLKPKDLRFLFSRNGSFVQTDTLAFSKAQLQRMLGQSAR